MNTLILNALAEPGRLQIVELLRDKPLSVNEIAEQLKMRQPQTSKHLQTLNKAGLVSVHKQAQQHIYSLETAPLVELGQWLQSFEEHINRQLQKLDEFLAKKPERM